MYLNSLHICSTYTSKKAGLCGRADTSEHPGRRLRSTKCSKFNQKSHTLSESRISQHDKRYKPSTWFTHREKVSFAVLVYVSGS